MRILVCGATALPDGRPAALLVEEHEILTCRSAQKSIAMARAWRPNIVLVDLRVLALAGCEIAAAIRKMRGGKHAVLLALSTKELTYDEKVLDEAGFNVHIVTACPALEVLLLLREILARRTVH